MMVCKNYQHKKCMERGKGRNLKRKVVNIKRILHSMYHIKSQCAGFRIFSLKVCVFSVYFVYYYDSHKNDSVMTVCAEIIIFEFHVNLLK
jgi:hypothetical protein